MAPPIADGNLDDVEDLDDIIGEFSEPHTQPTSKPCIPISSTAPPLPQVIPSESKSPQSNEIKEDDTLLDEEFAKELQAGLEAMLSSLGVAPNEGETYDPSGSRSTGPPADVTADEAQFLAAFEKMMTGENIPVFDPMISDKGKGRDSGDVETSNVMPANFQDAIRASLDKMKESDRGVTEDLGTGGADFASMLEALGGAGGSDGEIMNMFQGFMEELMSKEMLEEPLKTLSEQYPPYLAANGASLPPADKARYEAQLSAVNAMLAIFESPTYSPDDPAMSKRIVELMSQMQEAGNPPKEIIGDMPEGFPTGPDGMPAIPEGCIVM